MLFGHRMAHFSTIFTIVGSSKTTRFGSLEFPALPPDGMWVPLIFKPSQAFLYGSLDFVADRLSVLHLHEEPLVLAPVKGGASSVVSGTPSDFNNKAPVLHSEPAQGSNPTMSNMCFVLYLLFTGFRRFSGGIPLSLP